MTGSAFCRLEASAARPSCPFCGRVAGAWYSVPLCQACRRRLAQLPPLERRAALAFAYLAPAAPPRKEANANQISLL